ncbi:MAG: hypothetical protein IJ167_02080 [Lachnospiraceae bacterium]|nr:hypothetical protein [Lachnospiraceae bacterium]
MSGLIQVRDAIRNFLRRFDEVISPIFYFIAAWFMFWSINNLYGYSELFERGIVTFLLSVICALVSAPMAVLIGCVVIIFNCFFVAKEIGIIAVLVFIIIYCMYMRMFPDCAWILFFVPIMYIFKMTYAIPLIVAIFAGASGIVPAAIGIFLYKFAIGVSDINSMLLTAVKKEDVDIYSYLIDNVLKDKDMLLTAIVFAIVILLTFFIYRLPFDYSWYVAIGAGGIINVLTFMVVGVMMDMEIPFGSLVFGSFVGILVTVVVQICKRLVDYSRKEVVQFEDDDYYYYVKAVPKYGVAEKKKTVKKITGQDNSQAEKKVQKNVSENMQYYNEQRNVQGNRQRKPQRNNVQNKGPVRPEN